MTAATDHVTGPAGGTPAPNPHEIDLDLLLAAVELVVTSGFASTAMLQRKLRVGFIPAGALMDQLATHRIVSAANDAGERRVLIQPARLTETLAAVRAAWQPAAPTAATNPAPAPAPARPAMPSQPAPAPAPVSAPPAAAAEPAPAEPARSKPGIKARAGAAIAGWRGFMAEPMSVKEAWKLSAIVDERRIPEKSPRAAMLWWFSNRIDRPLLFLALLMVPTWANGPVLWCAQRPTRRWGLYLVLFLLFFVVPAAAVMS